MIIEWLKWRIELVKMFFDVLRDNDHLVLVAEVEEQIWGYCIYFSILTYYMGNWNSICFSFLSRKNIGVDKLAKNVR